MKIPKYVDKLIERRMELALQLAVVSHKLDKWLEKNGIPLGDDYTLAGCMIYCEPCTAAKCVRYDIENFERNKTNEV